MASLFLLVALLLLPGFGVSALADDVESKNTDMATAIDEQDKKVQAQSDAMVNAIEKNSKRVDDQSLEKEFERASSRVDEVTDSADEKMATKDKEVEDSGTKAEDSIAKHAKMVDDLADEASSRQEAQSKRVEEIGNTFFKTKQTRAKPRTSISYHVALPEGLSPKSLVDKFWYGWKDTRYANHARGRQFAPHGLVLPRNEERFQDPDWSGGDAEANEDRKLKHFLVNDAIGTDRIDGHSESFTPKVPIFASTAAGWSSREVDRSFWGHPPTHPSTRSSPAREKASSFEDYSEETRPTGLLVLHGTLPDELKNQIEEDAMLKTWASKKHSQDSKLLDALNSRNTEDEIERGWVEMNGIGSPEMRRPAIGENFDTVGGQTISSMSPAQVELLQDELPGNHA